MYRITLIALLLLTGLVSRAEYENLSTEVEKLLEGSPVPALSIAAVKDGKILSAGAHGVRKMGTEEAVTIQDKFHLGSCTKSMTALLAGMLVDDGRVRWDRTLAETFPKLKMHQKYKEVSLKELLTNTGGLPEELPSQLWTTLLFSKASGTYQRSLLRDNLLAREPKYDPGTAYLYSNAGFSIAGSMMESISGKPYETLLKERLFTPLKLSSAGFGAPATPGKVDQPYGHHRKFGRLLAVNPEPFGDNPPAIAPATSVHMSVLDFATYLLFFLGEHPAGETLLSEDSKKALLTPISLSSYAMGWGVSTRDWAGGRCYNHHGSNTMFYCIMRIAPQKDFGAVAMCNIGGPEGKEKCEEAITLLIQKHLEE